MIKEGKTKQVVGNLMVENSMVTKTPNTMIMVLTMVEVIIASKGEAGVEGYNQQRPKKLTVQLTQTWTREVAASKIHDVLKVSLFDTEIVKVVANGYVTLNSGGFRTMSTLIGMNAVVKPVNLQVEIQNSSSGEWKVRHIPSGVVQNFSDNMVISSFANRDW
eukprot:CAMPEP_0117744314 /NCGR_PEP_ID=MMETSP0947-20121206/6678_1 /TAXON_ID=44440 /ORGANISM="Chattonella subsalsa, Strain CCMP2191" /LENGTH=161 /DNA_ID=CAMNT_0005561225 /DNA_START=137 /DNA_END=619 /DNA_ORIENTATION=+